MAQLECAYGRVLCYLFNTSLLCYLPMLLLLLQQLSLILPFFLNRLWCTCDYSAAILRKLYGNIGVDVNSNDFVMSNDYIYKYISKLLYYLISILKRLTGESRLCMIIFYFVIAFLFRKMTGMSFVTRHHVCIRIYHRIYTYLYIFHGMKIKTNEESCIGLIDLNLLLLCVCIVSSFQHKRNTMRFDEFFDWSVFFYG